MKALDLGGAGPASSTFARRFFDDGLPAALSSRAFERAALHRRYSEDQLGWGLQAWRLRALDEYRSLVGLAEYLEQLTELGCTFDVLATAVRVVRDEARHVELCRRMVHALGGDDVIPGRPRWSRSNRRRPLLERALTTTVGSLCIGETISVAILAGARKVTTDPLARAVLTVLTADESVHSQFGWTLLPVLWPRASAAQRRALTAYARQCLQYAERAVFENSGGARRRRNPFGDLTTAERRAIYALSVSRDVVGRFGSLGIKVKS